MKKQVEKDKLTALYERLSQDNERTGKAYLSRTKTGFVKDNFTYKFNEIFL